MNRWFTGPVLVIFFFGCVAVTYGIADLLLDPSGPWPKRLRLVGHLFAFGAWAGIVFVGEDNAWFPKQRRFVNAGLLAGLMVYFAWQLSAPNLVTLLLVAAAAGIAGFYAERWLPHI